MKNVRYTIGGRRMVMNIGTRREKAIASADAMSKAGMGTRPGFGGVAVVCCVHDREKRVVTTEQQVFELGVEWGIVYDPKQHRIHRCACCDNLFFDPSDEPKYCVICHPSRLVHPLGGPLASPIGEVDG